MVSSLQGTPWLCCSARLFLSFSAKVFSLAPWSDTPCPFAPGVIRREKQSGGQTRGAKPYLSSSMDRWNKHGPFKVSLTNVDVYVERWYRERCKDKWRWREIPSAQLCLRQPHLCLSQFAQLWKYFATSQNFISPQHLSKNAENKYAAHHPSCTPGPGVCPMQKCPTDVSAPALSESPPRDEP